MPYDVCISYSSLDRDRILALAEQLRGEGVSVWIDQGGNDAVMLYNLCCVLCFLGERDKAAETFGRALAAGYGNLQWAGRDPDLEPIRDNPTYIALMGGS